MTIDPIPISSIWNPRMRSLSGCSRVPKIEKGSPEGGTTPFGFDRAAEACRCWIPFLRNAFPCELIRSAIFWALVQSLTVPWFVAIRESIQPGHEAWHQGGFVHLPYFPQSRVESFVCPTRDPIPVDIQPRTSQSLLITTRISKTKTLACRNGPDFGHVSYRIHTKISCRSTKNSSHWADSFD